MNKIALALILAAGNSHALTWVQTPKGNYAVDQIDGGFAVYGLSGQGVTMVTRQGNGYSVQGPNGTTNVYTDGTTSNPNVTVDPFDLGVTPIPNMGD